MHRLLEWLTRRSRDLGQEKSHMFEAEAALRRAEADLAKTRARRPEVDRLAAELRRAREENHFGARVAWSYGLRGARE